MTDKPGGPSSLRPNSGTREWRTPGNIGQTAGYANQGDNVNCRSPAFVALIEPQIALNGATISTTGALITMAYFEDLTDYDYFSEGKRPRTHNVG